jgi:hypothetical protein
MSDGDEGGAAWLGGHVLEFVDERGGVRWAWELEGGRQYRLVVTTSAGLVRYDLDDLVEVTGFAQRAPVLRFVRKGANVISVTGEKVTEDQVVRAFAATGVRAVGFSVGVRMAEVPVLVLAVEGEVPGDLAARFDVALRRANVEYDAKRDSGRLGPVALKRLDSGTYARLRSAKVAAGAPEGQVKDVVIDRRGEVV